MLALSAEADLGIGARPNSRRSSSAANQAKHEDPRKRFHLAVAIYIQSAHCDFISQLM
jgi:hypothetical protein